MKIYIILFVGFIIVLSLVAIQSFITSSVVNEIQYEQLQQDIQTERLIDNAIEQSIRDNPNGDPNISLQRLRELQDK